MYFYTDVLCGKPVTSTQLQYFLCCFVVFCSNIVYCLLRCVLHCFVYFVVFALFCSVLWCFAVILAIDIYSSVCGGVLRYLWTTSCVFCSVLQCFVLFCGVLYCFVIVAAI